MNTNYLKDSLFDKNALENRGQKRDYKQGTINYHLVTASGITDNNDTNELIIYFEIPLFRFRGKINGKKSSLCHGLCSSCATPR